MSVQEQAGLLVRVFPGIFSEGIVPPDEGVERANNPKGPIGFYIEQGSFRLIPEHLFQFHGQIATFTGLRIEINQGEVFVNRVSFGQFYGDAACTLTISEFYVGSDGEHHPHTDGRLQVWFRALSPDGTYESSERILCRLDNPTQT